VVVVGAGCAAPVCAKALAATSVKPKPAINERAEVYFMA
jgi:ribulose 1,5-bisphosphate synthetase/thiazole synthase